MGFFEILSGLILFGLISTAVLVIFIPWYAAIDYSLTDEQRREARKTKFCIVGGGVSGICVGYFFKLMNLDFVIIEKVRFIKTTVNFKIHADFESGSSLKCAVLN